MLVIGGAGKRHLRMTRPSLSGPIRCLTVDKVMRLKKKPGLDTAATYRIFCAGGKTTQKKDTHWQ